MGEADITGGAFPGVDSRGIKRQAIGFRYFFIHDESLFRALGYAQGAP